MRKVILLAISVLAIGGITFFFFKKEKFSKSKKDFQEENALSIQMLKLAKSLEKEGKFKESKRIYLKIISKFPQDINVIKIAKKEIENLTMRILFSPQEDEFSTFYVVKPGDTLEKIAKKFNTTVEYIKVANNLKFDTIKPNQRLKVCKAKFYVVIDKSQNLLFLKADDKIIKTYRVSTGKENCTPTGDFKIVNRIKHPTWFKNGKAVPYGSPENVLGDYWLGLDISGYGIHGTNEPETIGQHVTQGCVRMYNEDVKELYILLPVGTPVKIID